MGARYLAMTRAVSANRFAVAVYAAVLALLAVPILSAVVPPLVDYPNHLARMHVLAERAFSPELQKNYLIVWKLSPYLAMDLIVPALARVMSIYTAGRVFLFLCLALMVLGTAALHAALHRRFSAWPAVSALVCYSFVLSYGFVNYVMGIGVWLFALAGWVLLSRRAEAWRLAGGLALSLPVYFSHYFAFCGYMLCVGAYEFGVWLGRRDGGFPGLIRRGAVALVAFIPPWVMFWFASQGQEGGPTVMADPAGWVRAMISPFLFWGVPGQVTLLALALIVPARRGLFGPVGFAQGMRMPLLALGLAAMAMPDAVAGVWGTDYRLPVVWVCLAIAACGWPEAPSRWRWPLAGGLAGLLAVNMASIVWTWRPLVAEYDAFRAAVAVIPRGAKVLAFRDDGMEGPFTDQLPALAVIERDAFLPFLFSDTLASVRPAADLREIGSPHGQTLRVADLTEGADPVSGPGILGRRESLGVRNYWGGWPDRFDYLVQLGGADVPRSWPSLALAHADGFERIYRIVR